MDDSFTIGASKFNSLSSHAYDCNIITDKSFLISCADGYHAIDQIDRFISSKDKRVSDSDILRFSGKIKNMRSRGPFTMFNEPGTGILQTLEYKGRGNYRRDKYGTKTSGKGQPRFIDGIVNDGLFTVLLETNGKRAVQIHLRNDAFTNVASINSINGAKASCVSLDMIYDKLYSKYHTYVILKSADTGKVQMIEVIF